MWNVGHQHFLSLGEFTGIGEGFLDKFIYGAIKVMPIVVVSYGVGLGIEFFIASKKGHPINEGFLVSGMLIPLIMPPAIPLWMVAGNRLCCDFAKRCLRYRYEYLNVALVARVFYSLLTNIYVGRYCWIAESGCLFRCHSAAVSAATGLEGSNKRVPFLFQICFWIYSWFSG